ncbi:heavy metal-associated domain-containing protein [Sporichthya sp.]|uniref:cation transporter n=1 Tax=Sporichthya sp. TaxID=65475 RepID=UPI00181A33B9|nr:heavy metal-associated domain-containing protein [Sporichthya sp.]MBA3744609.1 heavy-metal-associated domain-containing protein [Sporichthya sp.]
MKPHAHTGNGQSTTVVLDVRGILRASEQAVVAAALRRRPGVLEVEVNPVAQSATVRFDLAATSLAQLREWVRDCGYHCAGQSVPTHLCDPMSPPLPSMTEAQLPAPHAGRVGSQRSPATAPSADLPRSDHHEGADHSPHEVMGHGGHSDMSMAGMVRDPVRAGSPPVAGRSPLVSASS